MKAYRTYLTVDESQQLTIKELPFRPGSRVEVLMIAADGDFQEHSNMLQDLLKRTQALPHLASISDEDIVAEIDAHRRRHE